MSDAISPARERKRINARAELIERAIAGIHLQIDDLPTLRDQIIAVVSVLQGLNDRAGMPVRAVDA